MATTTAAVVVAFRSDTDPIPLLSALAGTIGPVLLVDNHGAERPEVAARAAALGVPYLHGANRGGLAGAYNLALRHMEGMARIAQVVFLDEDSDPGTLVSLLRDDSTVRAMAQPDVAAVSPAYRDRATGLRGKYLLPGRWRLRFYPREFEGLRPVGFVINSMTVWRRDALRRVGAFNEALAVDHVDTEYCLRSRHAGMALLVNGSFEFAHSIGQRRTYRLFGVQLQAGGHAPERRYLIGRNTVYLAFRWAWREPAFAALCMARVVYEAVGIVAAEDRAPAKLWALMRGALRGLSMVRAR